MRTLPPGFHCLLDLDILSQPLLGHASGPSRPPSVPFQIIPPGGRIDPRMEVSMAVCRSCSTQWAWTTGNQAIAAASSMKRGLTCSPPSAEAPMSDPRYSRRCMGSRDTVQLVERLPGAQEALGSIPHKPDAVLALWRKRQAGGESELILSYVMISRPAWAT